MKCWECKCSVHKVHVVHYLSENQNKEATRHVCPDCYKKLKFNAGNYIEVDKITQRSLKGA